MTTWASSHGEYRHGFLAQRERASTIGRSAVRRLLDGAVRLWNGTPEIHQPSVELAGGGLAVASETEIDLVEPVLLLQLQR